MGKIIETVTVTKVVENRCRSLTFDAPKGSDQLCIQEYENCTLIDGVQVASEKDDIKTVAVKDILDIIIVINGREISGQDVASWIYLINDNRAEIMEKRYFDPSK